MMADSMDRMRTTARQDESKQLAGMPGGGLLREAWRALDPLYLWSAAAGLLVALVLIAIAVARQTRLF